MIAPSHHLAPIKRLIAPEVETDVARKKKKKRMTFWKLYFFCNEKIATIALATSVSTSEEDIEMVDNVPIFKLNDIQYSLNDFSGFLIDKIIKPDISITHLPESERNLKEGQFVMWEKKFAEECSSEGILCFYFFP